MLLPPGVIAPPPYEVPMVDTSTGLLKPPWLEHLQSLGIAIDVSGTIPCPAQDPLTEEKKGAEARKVSKQILSMRTGFMTRPWRDYFAFLGRILAKTLGPTITPLPMPVDPIVDPETGMITTPWIEWFHRIKKLVQEVFDETGLRTATIGQVGMFCEEYVNDYPASDVTTWLVDIVTWMQNGLSKGNVWLPNRADHDFSFFYGAGGVNQQTVGASCEAALTAAGFTVTRGDPTEEFDFADGLYDVLIVGGTNAANEPDFASGESDANRGQMIADFVLDGGAAIVMTTNNNWQTTYFDDFHFGGSGALVHNHNELCDWTAATAINSDLFRPGIKLHLKLHNYPGVSAPIIEGETHRKFWSDQCTVGPRATMVVYSGYNDAGPPP